MGMCLHAVVRLGLVESNPMSDAGIHVLQVPAAADRPDGRWLRL
jgi:hypothetical protein